MFHSWDALHLINYMNIKIEWEPRGGNSFFTLLRCVIGCNNELLSSFEQEWSSINRRVWLIWIRGKEQITKASPTIPVTNLHETQLLRHTIFVK